MKAIEDTKHHLVVVGNTKSDYAQRVMTFIKGTDLEQRVQFLKNVSMQELAMIYQDASLFVYPSIFEGFGIPIIEALYSKTPVISSKDGCFSEAGGENSMYIDPMNVAEIKASIETVLSSAELQFDMINNGFNYAQRFNDDVIATNFNQVYTKLLHD